MRSFQIPEARIRSSVEFGFLVGRAGSLLTPSSLLLFLLCDKACRGFVGLHLRPRRLALWALCDPPR